MSATRTLQVNTPDGPIQITLQAGDDVVHVSAIAGQAHQLTDTLMDATVRAVESRGFAITCGRGCAACCRHLVAVTPLEAFVLASAVEGMPTDAQARISERTIAVMTQLDAAGLNERIDSIAAGDAGREVVRDYFRQQLACPLLEDESCTAYEARPAACRQLLVVSDPAQCARPQDGGVRVAPVILDLTTALERLSGALFPGQPRRMPLVRALKWVADNEPLWEVGATGVNLVNALMQALGSKPSAGPDAPPG